MSERAPRVMQSFKRPRPSTNPYITMLDRALAGEPSIEHVRFSWRDALLTRVDVLHLHWPEVMLEGDRGWKRWGKRSLMRLLLLKLRLTDAAVVRTVHNLELPQDIDPATSRLLVALEGRTTHRIVLNSSTGTAESTPSTLIPHGHYRDWFAPFPRSEQVPRRVGYFGLIRRYKGVETLLEAYAAARVEDPALSLRIGGKPSSPELAAVVEDAAAGVPDITVTLRFLEDAELVGIASSSQLIVLPYRFMHNSGGALAALSLDRPVLVPRNDVNVALAQEVGEEWVLLYDDELTASRLRDAVDEASSAIGSPDLTRRDWDGVGRAHAIVYRTALAGRRR